MELGKRILKAPILARIDGQARRPGVDFAGVQVPAKFVGLAAVEAGGFQSHVAVSESDSDYIVGNVGGVVKVVCERRDRIFRRGWPVRIGEWAHGRVAHRRSVK